MYYPDSNHQDAIDKRMDPLNHGTPEGTPGRVCVVGAAIYTRGKQETEVHHWVNTRHNARGASATPLVWLLNRSRTIVGVAVYEKPPVTQLAAA